MKIGFVGLGKMGSRMIQKLLLEGYEVVAWNRSSAPIGELKLKVKNEKLKVAGDIENLVQSLEAPRVIWVMVSAGEATQNILDELAKFVSPNDIVIDGGNSHFTDTQKRFEMFAKKKIRFLGIGVSGGVIAGTQGYPLMAGGDKSAYDFVRPILESLAKPNGGYEYFGKGGAGHFVKMAHNAIEYSYMQGLAEGFEILEKSPYEVDLLKVAKLYQKGTLLSGFMIDRVKDALEKDPQLSSSVGSVAASGEADWAIEQAKKENIDIENISQALEFRKKTLTNIGIQKSFTAKMLNALRREFGGHEIQK